MSLASTCATWRPARAVGEHGCSSDPAEPPAQWIYENAAIGFVLSGWFEYASEDACVLAAPGAVILGNAGEPFSVRHFDRLGNRRMVAVLKRELLEEVARECDLAPRFGAIALPPSRIATRLFSLMRAPSPDACEDALYSLAYAALTTRTPRAPERFDAAARCRVRAAVRHIEAHFDEPCTLQSLAALAGLSRFHFVRVFGAVVGQSPNQYLTNTRLRAAAERLRDAETPIVQVAFEVGFNDISHFYACFREAFGCTPRQWRMA